MCFLSRSLPPQLNLSRFPPVPEQKGRIWRLATNWQDVCHFLTPAQVLAHHPLSGEQPIARLPMTRGQRPHMGQMWPHPSGVLVD
jgi:hypothetical protein